MYQRDTKIGTASSWEGQSIQCAWPILYTNCNDTEFTYLFRSRVKNAFAGYAAGLPAGWDDSKVSTATCTASADNTGTQKLCPAVSLLECVYPGAKPCNTRPRLVDQLRWQAGAHISSSAHDAR